MDSPDKTIIYYSACTEDPIFEEKIRQDLIRKAGDIPIISVTRKPVNLGTNICVGETPVCYTNEWRQLLIGLKAAKTKYCMTAEADCLYPEDYFAFTPPKDDTVYYYDNIYIVWKNHPGFYKKTGHCEGAEICNREYWISRIEPLLGEGWEPNTREWENETVRKFFPNEDIWTGNGMISFKTGKGVSVRTTFINSKKKELPYWGDVNSLKAKYL